MICDRCNSLCFMEEERTLRGVIFSPACYSCGWRGPVMIDNRIKKGEFVMAKKGTCINPSCKKENTQLVAKGLCYTCYMKQKGPSKPKNCKSHSAVKHIEIQPKQKTTVFLSDGDKSSIIEVPRIVTTAEIKEQLENKVESKSSINQILLTFEPRDSSLLGILKKNAETNRRTIENEIMFILDQNNIALIKTEV